MKEAVASFQIGPRARRGSFLFRLRSDDALLQGACPGVVRAVTTTLWSRTITLECRSVATNRVELNTGADPLRASNQYP